MGFSMLELHAQEKVSLPSGFSFFRWEALPFGEPTQVYRLTGAIEGKYKNGRAKWSRPFTEVFITTVEHDAWRAAWELKTGLCSACAGSKEELAKWSATEGTTMRPCSRCKGSGASTVAEHSTLPSTSEEKQ